MNIDLYTMSGEETFVDKDNSWNITGRTSHLTLLTTLTGDIRTDCNLLDPRVLINSFAPLNYPAINYARIRDFDRYYFVRSITAAPEQGRGMFYLDMHVDVLMTYKADIVNVGGIVERSERVMDISSENFYPDSLLPRKCVPVISVFAPTTQRDPFNVDYGEYSNIDNISLTVANPYALNLSAPSRAAVASPLQRPDPLFLSGGVQTWTYCTNKTNLYRLSDLLNTTDWFDAVLKGVYGVGSEAIIKSVVFPFDIPTHDAQGVSSARTETIKIAGKALINTQDPNITPKAYNVYPHYSCIFDLAEHTFPAALGFQQYDPYVRYEIYLPYVGWRELTCADILGKTIKVQYLIDIVNGACTAIVHDGVRIILQASGQIGIDIPQSSTNATDTQRNSLSALMTTSIGALSALMTGGATAPLVLGATLARGAESVLNNRVIARGNAPEAALSRWAPSKVWIMKSETQFPTLTQYGKTVGYLVNRSVDALSTHKGWGFTKLNKAHLDTGFATATYDERQEIASLLESGIIM